MTDLEKLQARLANTEKALFALTTVLMDLQPPGTQQDISRIMGDYFEANTSLGFEPSVVFLKEGE